MDTNRKFRIVILLSLLGIILTWIPIDLQVGEDYLILGGHVWYTDNKGFITAFIFSALSSLFFIIMPLVLFKILKEYKDENEVVIEES